MGLHTDTVVNWDVMGHVIMSMDHVIVSQDVLAAGVRMVRLSLLTKSLCLIECPPGLYGQDCSQSCPDKCDHGCHHVDGICTCAAGFTGKQCKECKYSKYNQQ